MAADRHVMVEILFYLVAVTGPTLVIWAAVRLVPVVFGFLHGGLRSLAALSSSSRSPGGASEGPSFEQAVRNLQRLRAELLGPPQGTNVRRVALLAAYDDVLLTVCGQVGIDAELRGADDAEKAFARLQTEAAVEAAGVTLDPPRAGPTAV